MKASVYHAIMAGLFLSADAAILARINANTAGNSVDEFTKISDVVSLYAGVVMRVAMRRVKSDHTFLDTAFAHEQAKAQVAKTGLGVVCTPLGAASPRRRTQTETGGKARGPPGPAAGFLLASHVARAKVCAAPVLPLCCPCAVPVLPWMLMIR